MRVICRLIGAAVTLSLSWAHAWSWGNEGHRTIGMVADLILDNDPVGAKVNQLLGGVTLSEASLWADCAKGVCHRPLSADERVFVDHNPQHRAYHYTDVPIQQAYYKLGMAGTRNNDVVQIIKQAINVLRGASPNQGPAVLDRKEALWVLAHMIGDIHQPLHVGAIYYDQQCKEVVDPNVVGTGKPDFGIGTTVASTKGGNNLKMPNGNSFHVAYWDQGTVTGAMRLAGFSKGAIDAFARSIVANPPVGWEVWRGNRTNGQICGRPRSRL